MTKFDWIAIGLSALSLLMLFYIVYISLRFNSLKKLHFASSSGKEFLPASSRTNAIRMMIMIAFFVPTAIFFNVLVMNQPEKKFLVIAVDIFILSFLLAFFMLFSLRGKLYKITADEVRCLVRDKYLSIQKKEIRTVKILPCAEAEQLIFENRYGGEEGRIVIGPKKDHSSPLTWYLSIPTIEKSITRNGDRLKLKSIKLGADVVLIETHQDQKYLISPADKEGFCKGLSQVGINI
ncbi:MAG: hypothetical protein IPM74_10595 [Crocinitomicaceae bacterium]|nr:hypothetical protein [Crocinitomicaceae bacterium]MBK8926336.1 hypothetical protein [Crocinitomicaceae bacterium]